jgi:hypothetical protein
MKGNILLECKKIMTSLIADPVRCILSTRWLTLRARALTHALPLVFCSDSHTHTHLGLMAVQSTRGSRCPGHSHLLRDHQGAHGLWHHQRTRAHLSCHDSSHTPSSARTCRAAVSHAHSAFVVRTYSKGSRPASTTCWLSSSVTSTWSLQTRSHSTSPTRTLATGAPPEPVLLASPCLVTYMRRVRRTQGQEAAQQL